jgi:nitrous oxidase accessory protein NosD
VIGGLRRVCLAFLLLGPAPAAVSAAPCVRPTRPGTQVQGEVRICPGRYRIADPSDRGVIIAAASGTRIDLTGVVLESGDSVPSRYVGIGIASKGVDAVSIEGGAVRGYRFGIRLDGGRSHRIAGVDVSGSRSQALRSTAQRADSADRLDLATPETFVGYGGGILLQGVVGASIVGVTARGSQNGIALLDVREAFVADNDLPGNSGWAIQLWRSSGNVITRNRAQHTARCPAAAFDCRAAAILLREASDSNLVTDNDLSSSSIGLLVTGIRPLTRPSIGNLIYRNNATLAARCAFTAEFTWSATFLENRADSAARGFFLDHLTRSALRGNTVIGAREAAIAVEHGSDNTIAANLLLDARVGITISAPRSDTARSQGIRVDDNVLGGMEEGISLSGTTASRLRGNVLDRMASAVVIDEAGHATELTGNVFLRVSRWFIEAPDLSAGGNYWAATDVASTTTKVRGRISVLPWKPASLAGY